MPTAPKKGDLTNATPNPEIPRSSGGTKQPNTAPAQGTTNGNIIRVSKPKK